MLRLLARFAKHQSGASAIEYALVAGGIAMAVLATVRLIGPKVLRDYTAVLAGF